MLSISLLVLPTSGISLASFQVTNQNPSNTTQIQPSESQQSPSETQLKPFTIPRGDTGNSEGSADSQFSPPGSDEDNIQDDIVLLNQNYDNERFGDRLVGELLNNGTETAEFVHVSASFYDEDGVFLGSSSGYTEPSSIPPGGKAGFNILITSDTIEDDSERYEFTIQWNDDDFDQHTIRITGEQTESNDNDNNDNDNQESHIIISSHSEPQTDPRNDPKYDSIDWQDDRGEEYNLSQEEMDEILEERENEESDGGGDSDSSGGDDGGGDSDSSGGDDGGGDE